MTKKKASKLKKTILIGTFGVAGLFAGFFSNEGIIQFTDYLFRTPKEIALENQIKKPLFFDFTSRGEKRDIPLEGLRRYYEKAQNKWDNFDQQFDLVYRVCIRDVGPSYDKEHYGANMNRSGKLTINFVDDRSLMDDGGLIHELAHMWYFLRTDTKFDRSWKEITDNHYISKGITIEDLAKNGAVSRYALTSINEDIAETVEFVYEINQSDIQISGFPNKGKDILAGPTILTSNSVAEQSIPKIRRKLELLREYNFFSEREHKNALNELAGFSNQKPREQ